MLAGIYSYRGIAATKRQAAKRRNNVNSVQIEFFGLGSEMRLCRLLCGRALPFREPQSKANLFSLGAKAEPSRPARTLKCAHLPGKPQAFRTAGGEAAV
jgi:hypothetical protein